MNNRFKDLEETLDLLISYQKQIKQLKRTEKNLQNSIVELFRNLMLAKGFRHKKRNSKVSCEHYYLSEDSDLYEKYSSGTSVFRFWVNYNPLIQNKRLAVTFELCNKYVIHADELFEQTNDYDKLFENLSKPSRKANTFRHVCYFQFVLFENTELEPVLGRRLKGITFEEKLNDVLTGLFFESLPGFELPLVEFCYREVANAINAIDEQA